MSIIDKRSIRYFSRPVESKVSHHQIVEITRRSDGKKATVKRGEFSLELKVVE